ncbi:HAD family hydrolase [Granulicoccus phenolivorans]|uniref:HAD family hydrolase n=1 Tax=Granulicoccus phenolivorans TaxID=266854 RepID=UPI0004231B64|nr:HAD family phosphatase [Granulicoccus phenolivorans]
MTTSTAASPLPFAAVMWDFDGTLLDSEPIWIGIELAMVTEMGGDAGQYDVASQVGSSLLDTGAYMIELAYSTGGKVTGLTPQTVVGDLVARVSAEIRARRLEWRPGAKELLLALHEAGVPQALVSASYRDVLAAAAEQLPGHVFDTIVAGDDVRLGKPHPEPYLTGAARLGVAATDCVVIEDSVTGAAAGNAAGAIVIAVPNEVRPPAAARRIEVESLAGVGIAELSDLVRRAAAGSVAQA